jgi:hypothetical protein
MTKQQIGDLFDIVDSINAELNAVEDTQITTNIYLTTTNPREEYYISFLGDIIWDSENDEFISKNEVREKIKEEIKKYKDYFMKMEI